MNPQSNLRSGENLNNHHIPFLDLAKINRSEIWQTDERIMEVLLPQSHFAPIFFFSFSPSLPNPFEILGF
ncbi:hypothetical protein P8452_65074 [Trifolium repens]|nr:hypothetical protein P8452_65074 [Trifolium repens]